VVLTRTQRATTEAEAVAWLVSRVPELQRLVDEHVACHRELLPYLVCEGDFLRWFIDRVRADDQDPTQRFMAAIEGLLTRPRTTRC
jgi:hypothetical protein